jgi:uncharacterized SAM-binding protein YcdF (DUF218 family)
MRFLLSILMFAAIAWAVALAWFLASMPNTGLDASQKADAIIVLTGGADRVEHGFEMLAEGAAPVLFISGVGEHVTKNQMLAEHASAEIRSKIAANEGEIMLDHIARSTVSNANESAEFIRERGIKTIRLVTASYHMLRSIAEFKSASPGLTIYADPVFPENFRRDNWWQHENTRRLVFSEFYKYWAVVLRDVLRP